MVSSQVEQTCGIWVYCQGCIYRKYLVMNESAIYIDWNKVMHIAFLDYKVNKPYVY